MIKDDRVFVLSVWAVSRFIVLAAAMFAPNGLAGLGSWDAAWYGLITQHSYEYAPDGKQHSVAFFPLFPMLCALLTHIGIPFIAAAMLINAVASLVALYVLHGWLQRYMPLYASRSAVAAVALLPMSLFTTVAYSEALYLALSVLALRDLDEGRYVRGALLAALCAVTRPIGVLLAVPALLVAVRTNTRAALMAFAGLAGLGAFAVYLYLAFGDPLAFVHVQTAWRHEPDGGRTTWMLTLLLGLGIDPITGTWDWTVSLVQLAVAGAVFAAWRYGQHFRAWEAMAVAAAVTAAEWWAFGAGAGRMTFVVVGVLTLLLAYRQLPPVMIAYGVAGLIVALLSGSVLSVERIVYAGLLVPVAIGVTLARIPRFAPGIYAVSAVILAIDALTFARAEWVA